MTPEALAAALEATWPPAASRRLGPWRLRDGAGGGKRVSAATAEGAWTQSDIDAAEAAMADPLFMIRPEDAALDRALAGRGYARIDPVVAYAVPTAGAAPAPAMRAFPHWPPLEIALDLWAQGHIGPARIAVMQRATGPKTAILARTADRATGVAFVAVHDGTAMLHALEVTTTHRRQGAARTILAAAGVWARDHGADTLALVVTEANQPARALYASQGMQLVGQYHYRQSKRFQSLQTDSSPSDPGTF
jgi:GNAT superfamily N-acetyltransferase